MIPYEIGIDLANIAWWLGAAFLLGIAVACGVMAARAIIK